MFEQGQQKTAETAAFPIRAVEAVSLQRALKESLRQVLSIVRAFAEAAGIDLEGIPIVAAKPRESIVGPRGFTVAGGQHHAPMRGREDAGLRRD